MFGAPVVIGETPSFTDRKCRRCQVGPVIIARAFPSEFRLWNRYTKGRSQAVVQGVVDVVPWNRSARPAIRT